MQEPHVKQSRMEVDDSVSQDYSRLLIPMIYVIVFITWSMAGDTIKFGRTDLKIYRAIQPLGYILRCEATPIIF